MAKPGPKHKRRRLPILLRHAISLAVVFTVALPLSYYVGQRIIRHQHLAKLDSTDPATFQEGLGYVYTHAPANTHVRKAAYRRISSLPPEQAAELFWVLGQSLTRDGKPLPVIETRLGAALLERSDFANKFVVYNQLQQLGVGQDATVLAALATALDDPDDHRFQQAVAFYDSRFLWLRDHVPADAWLRWAVLLSRSDAALTQLRSAELLGDMPDALDDPRVAEGLAHLAGSDNPTVRGAVLDSAAGYGRVADDPVPYEQVLIALTEDDNETLARRAWITLGLLNPLSGFRADWRSVEPAIAEAMLWAAVKTNPDRPDPALEAMRTESYKAAGTLALNEWQQTGFTPPLEEHIIIKEVVELDPQQHRPAVNRAIHVAKQYLYGEWNVIEPYLLGRDDWNAKADLYYAAIWTCSWPSAPSAEPLENYDRRLVAHLEGYLHHGSPIAGNRLEEINPDWPILAVLLAAIFHDNESPVLYQDVFLSTAASSRDLAVIASVESSGTESFINEQLRSRQTEAVLASALLAGMTGFQPHFIEGAATQDRSFDELLALSDADLADLGLRRADALTTLLHIAETAPDREDRHEQIALLKLALWMRGDLGDGFIPEAEAMLEDDRLPTSTVLMCLLHMQRPAALYYLFDHPDAATGAPPLDLYDLFVNQRWWHVFSRLVPDTDLDLWLWGDPGAQAFQFEVMRQWVQVNRWRLEAGWWPGATPDE
jgi:hypothetical protein